MGFDQDANSPPDEQAELYRHLSGDTDLKGLSIVSNTSAVHCAVYSSPGMVIEGLGKVLGVSGPESPRSTRLPWQ